LYLLYFCRQVKRPRSPRCHFRTKRGLHETQSGKRSAGSSHFRNIKNKKLPNFMRKKSGQLRYLKGSLVIVKNNPDFKPTNQPRQSAPQPLCKKWTFKSFDHLHPNKKGSRRNSHKNYPIVNGRSERITVTIKNSVKRGVKKARKFDFSK
jgi:hypothetical protein